MAENTEKTQEGQTASEEKKGCPETEDLLHKFYLFGLGLRKDIEEAVSKLIERGEAETKDKEKTVNDVFEKAKEKSVVVENKLEEFVNTMLERMNLVSKEKYEALEKRVAELEQKMKEFHPE